MPTRRARRAVDTSIAAANSTHAWAWLVSADNSRRSQLESGRADLRLSLQAAQSGLAVHPNSQVLREFSEMDRACSKLHREVGVVAPARVQMLVRVGYAPPPPDSALRRAVAQVVRG